MKNFKIIYIIILFLSPTTTFGEGSLAHQLQSLQYEMISLSQKLKTAENPVLSSTFATNLGIKYIARKKARQISKLYRNAKMKFDKLIKSSDVSIWEVQLGSICGEYRSGSNNCLATEYSQFLIGEKSKTEWESSESYIYSKLDEAKLESKHSSSSDIKSCVNENPESKLNNVSITNRFMCNANERFSHALIDGTYSQHISNGFININRSINFNTLKMKNSSVFEKHKPKFTKALTCVKGFFARHQIKLNLVVSYNINSSQLSSDVVRVNLFERMDRLSHAEQEKNPDIESINASDWPILGASKNPQARLYNIPDKLLCSLYTHEIAHALGLNDQYLEAASCPDRIVISQNTDDIMKNSWKDPEKLNFTREQVQQLISPVCKPEIINQLDRDQSYDYQFSWTNN